MIRTVASRLAFLPLLALAGSSVAAPLPEASHFSFESQQQTLQMAWRDVAPSGKANGRTAVLLHGKNFCAGYWADTAQALAAKGFRVIVPEQIGFCASDMPQRYQFSLHQLADNTVALLDHAKVAGKVDLIGHSMGGMLATRLTLRHPDRVARLVLVNPIGLEDWQAKGAVWRGVDAAYKGELGNGYARIATYQKQNYYDGEWTPAYDALARELAAVYEGPKGKAYAWNAALTSEMVFTQPVIHDVHRLAAPTTLIIGERDRTAIGRDGAPADVAKALGDYPALGRDVAKRIPGATLVALDGLGHLPHIEAPERFRDALFAALRPDTSR